MSLEQTGRHLDEHHTRVEIYFTYDRWTIRDEDVPALALHIQRESLRQFVQPRHLADLCAVVAAHVHSDELVHEHFVVARRRQLIRGHEQIPLTPHLGGSAIRYRIEFHDETALVW